MICVEGPDNSGKSTLAQFLSHELCLPVKHSGGPPKAEFDISDRCQKLITSHHPLIIDRFPAISELVYAPLLRSVDPEDGYLFQMFIVRAIRRGWLFIYCRPRVTTILEGHKFKSYETEEHIQGVNKKNIEIIAAYDTLMSQIPHITYDFETAPPSFLNHLTLYARNFTHARPIR